MKKRVWSLLGLVLTAMIYGSICVGCGDTNNSGDQGNTDTFVIDGTAEVMNVSGNSVCVSDYYLYLIQYIYNYGIKPEQMDELTVNRIMTAASSDLKTEFIQNNMALAEGLSASDEYAETIESMITAFYGTFGEEFLNSYGIDETRVRDMIERQLNGYLLTNKATEDLVVEFKEEYEEMYSEYQFHRMYYALFPTVQYDSDGQMMVDESGNIISLPEEETEKQLVLAEEFRMRALEGLETGDADATMEALAEEYNIADYSGVQRNVNGSYSDELNQLVEGLSDGEISEVISTDVGYMIVRMDESNDTEFMDQMLTDFANQSAADYIQVEQQRWLVEAGADAIQPDMDIVAGIDVYGLCNEMNERGIAFEQ